MTQRRNEMRIIRQYNQIMHNNIIELVKNHNRIYSTIL